MHSHTQPIYVTTFLQTSLVLDMFSITISSENLSFGAHGSSSPFTKLVIG